MRRHRFGQSTPECCTLLVPREILVLALMVGPRGSRAEATAEDASNILLTVV